MLDSNRSMRVCDVTAERIKQMNSLFITDRTLKLKLKLTVATPLSKALLSASLSNRWTFNGIDHWSFWSPFFSFVLLWRWPQLCRVCKYNITFKFFSWIFLCVLNSKKKKDLLMYKRWMEKLFKDSVCAEWPNFFCKILWDILRLSTVKIQTDSFKAEWLKYYVLISLFQMTSLLQIPAVWFYCVSVSDRKSSHLITCVVLCCTLCLLERCCGGEKDTKHIWG